MYTPTRKHLQLHKSISIDIDCALQIEDKIVGIKNYKNLGYYGAKIIYQEGALNFLFARGYRFDA